MIQLARILDSEHDRLALADLEAVWREYHLAVRCLLHADAYRLGRLGLFSRLSDGHCFAVSAGVRSRCQGMGGECGEQYAE